MSLQNIEKIKNNTSTKDIILKRNIKLNPLPKLNSKRIKHISSYGSLSTNRERESQISNKDLSVFLFQNNDVDLVRCLNPDLDRDICDHILFKEYLKNNIGNEDMPEQMLSQKINLPKIKKITVNGILETQKKLTQNKKEAQRNLANNQLEKELYGNLRAIRKEYNDIKSKKKALYDKFEKISKEINTLNLELEVIESRYTDIYIKKMHNHNENNTYNESWELNNQNTSSPTKTDKRNYSSSKMERMKQIKSHYLAKKEQEDKKYQKFEQIKKYKEDLKNLDVDIKALNSELSELRKKDHNIVQKLMKHYEALLFKGKDTRSEGLIWIIKAMWGLGQNVPMQFIPTFLDFKSIEFLFKLANKSIELDIKKKLLNEQKKNLNIKLHRLYHFSNDQSKDTFSNEIYGGKNKRSSLVFKTNLIKKNSVLKRSVSQTNLVKSYIRSNNDDEEEDERNEKELNTFKQLSMLIEKNKNCLEIEKLPQMNDIENLQGKIKKIEIEIVELKKNEINRIFKEFIENDYQNKYHVSVDVVLAALLGEHTKNIEVNKFAKFKREYFDEIKNIRFYEYGKRKDST
jgi:hypothetical protein